MISISFMLDSDIRKTIRVSFFDLIAEMSGSYLPTFKLAPLDINGLFMLSISIYQNFEIGFVLTISQQSKRDFILVGTRASLNFNND